MLCQACSQDGWVANGMGYCAKGCFTERLTMTGKTVVPSSASRCWGPIYLADGWVGTPRLPVLHVAHNSRAQPSGSGRGARALRPQQYIYDSLGRTQMAWRLPQPHMQHP